MWEDYANYALNLQMVPGTLENYSVLYLLMLITCRSYWWQDVEFRPWLKDWSSGQPWDRQEEAQEGRKFAPYLPSEYALTRLPQVAAPKIVEENGVLSFVEYVLLPISALQTGEPKFVVERREGSPLVYSTIAQMHSDYREDILSPQILKPAVTDALNKLLEPIQADFKANQEWQDVEKLAYPPPPAPEKKVKAKKDKGSKFPGAAAAAAAAKKDVVAQPDGHVEGPGSAEVNVGKAEEGLKNLEVEEK
jgi:hypothetical protein